MLSRPFGRLLVSSERNEEMLWEILGPRSIASLALDNDCISGMCSPNLCPDDDVECVLASSVGYVLTLFSTDVALNGLLAALLNEVRAVLPEAPGVDTTLVSDSPIATFVPRPLQQLPATAIDKVGPAAEYLGREGYRTLGSLQGLSERAVIGSIGWRGEAFRAIELIWGLASSIRRLSVLHPELQYTESESVALADMVGKALNESLERVKGSKRFTTVLLSRLGIASGKAETLQQVADDLGVTRERVRQLEKKATERVDTHRFLDGLLPLRSEVCAIVMNRGGAMTIAEMCGEVSDRFGWLHRPTPRAMSSVLEFLPEVSIADNGDVVFAAGDFKCRECEVLTNTLRDLVVQDATASLEDVCERVRNSASRSAAGCAACESLRPGILAALLGSSELQELELILRGDHLIPARHAERDPLSIRSRAVELLRAAGTYLHADVIATRLTAEDPGRPVGAQGVLSRLQDHPDVVSWDTGSFIHRQHMPFPYSLIRQVEKWALDRLSTGDPLPMLSVHGAYVHFGEACAQAGIPSELALYSLLRISADDELVYPRYPRIYAACGFTGRIPLAVVAEEFIREAGGRVGCDDLRRFVVEAMGFKEFQFDQMLPSLPNVLRTQDGGLIHSDWVRVSHEMLAHITQHAENLVHREGHVSAVRVFEDLKVDCVVSGIDCPELLFSLIQNSEPEDVVASRYPLFVHREESEPTAVTILSSVEEYVKAKDGPCGYQELEEEFVDKRRYRALTVFQVVHRHHIHRYLPASVVHDSALGWSDASQATLEQIAERRYEQCVAAGRLYSTVRELLECENLPILAANLVWTEQLLSDLLSRSGRFLVLGNARNAYVPRSNAHSIETFGDLVAEVLRHEYHGGTSRELLEARLRGEGVILRQLTAGMLDGTRKLTSDGYEVMLVEFAHA